MRVLQLCSSNTLEKLATPFKSDFGNGDAIGPFTSLVFNDDDIHKMSSRTESYQDNCTTGIIDKLCSK